MADEQKSADSRLHLAHDLQALGAGLHSLGELAPQQVRVPAVDLVAGQAEAVAGKGVKPLG